MRAAPPWALPKAILFDLDDTLISAYRQPELAWLAIAGEFADTLSPLSPAEVAASVAVASQEFWADAERHRLGRLNLLEARRGIVARAFAALAAAGRPSPPDRLAMSLAERYQTYRDEQMYLFEGAHDVVDGLRRHGVKLALITNGTGPAQRAKIERFALVHRFDHIQIEGEHGFGKPEERAYRHAMAALRVETHETWMVGDNLEWEIAAPQRLGIHAIWHDTLGCGLPADSTVRPDRIIRSLRELLPAEGA
jgi:putative hydrolase of the HAD superfamily